MRIGGVLIGVLCWALVWLQPGPAAAQAKPLSPDMVREAQLSLIRLNYAPGPADGVLGRRTRSAIKAYQYDRGLAETGRLTHETYRILQADVAALAPPAAMGAASRPVVPLETRAPPIQENGEAEPQPNNAAAARGLEGDGEPGGENSPQALPTPPPPPPPPSD